jgi:hypothetical protein
MDTGNIENLPVVAKTFIDAVIKKMRYKKKVRNEVRCELTAHFEDALRSCQTDEEKTPLAEQMITDFGDTKILAVLIRRGKKRNRPLWKKAIIGTMKVIGILILFVLLRLGYMSINRVVPGIDYSKWLTFTTSGGRDESLNARDDILKAAELLDNQYNEAMAILANWPGDMNDEELELTKNYVQISEPAIDKFIEALDKPYYWANYQVKPGLDNKVINDAFFAHNITFSQRIVEAIMPPLSKYKRFAQRTNKRALLRAYQGDIDGAISDCLMLQDFGGRQIGKGLLIEQLVGTAIEAMGHNGIYTLIDRVELSIEQLEHIRQQIEIQFAGSESIINLEAEKGLWYDIVQRSFTDDGKGSGKVLLKGIPLVANNWKESIKVILGVGVPDRREVLRRVNSYFDNADKLFKRTPWQIVNEPGDIGWDDIGGDLVMLQMIGLPNKRISELSWRLRASRDGLITTVAIFRFEKEKGRLPSSLADLVEAGYLKALPKDPYSDGVLTYKQTDEGFVLYSVGYDLVDDGGQIGRYENGNVRQWPKRDKPGDIIFWPRRSMTGEVIIIKPVMMGPIGSPQGNQKPQIKTQN